MVTFTVGDFGRIPIGLPAEFSFLGGDRVRSNGGGSDADCAIWFDGAGVLDPLIGGDIAKRVERGGEGQLAVRRDAQEIAIGAEQTLGGIGGLRGGNEIDDGGAADVL